MCFTFHLIKLSNFLKYFFYIFKKFYYFRIRFILSSLILKIVLFKKNEYFKIVTCPIFFYIYFYGIRVIFIDVFINKWNVTSNIYFKNRLKFLPEFLTRLFKIYINRKFWLSIWNCICTFFCHLYIKHFVDAPNANFLYSKKKKKNEFHSETLLKPSDPRFETHFVTRAVSNSLFLTSCKKITQIVIWTTEENPSNKISVCSVVLLMYALNYSKQISKMQFYKK